MPSSNLSTNISTWLFSDHDGTQRGFRWSFRTSMWDRGDGHIVGVGWQTVQPALYQSYISFGFANPISDIAHDSGAPLYEPINVAVL